MEKIKFGIQLTLLMLAFPAWFMVEMKDAGQAMKKEAVSIRQQAPAMKPAGSGSVKNQTAVPALTVMPVSELVEVNR